MCGWKLRHSRFDYSIIVAVAVVAVGWGGLTTRHTNIIYETESTTRQNPQQHLCVIITLGRVCLCVFVFKCSVACCGVENRVYLCTRFVGIVRIRSVASEEF